MLMREKDKLRSMVKDMPVNEALDFLDKYKDFVKKPKDIMARIHDRSKLIGNIIKRGKWKTAGTDRRSNRGMK